MKQMVVNLLIFLLIVGAIYALAYPDSQFVSTASAIRQVWSGNCRLSCRQSELSGFSGLSGLGPGLESKVSRVAHSSHAGPSGRCACASCPCALIDNVLRTCRPATNMYSRAMGAATAGYYAMLDTLNNIYCYVQRVISCRASCQRPQLIEDNNSSSENIYFGYKNIDSVVKARDKPRKLESGLISSRSIVFRDVSDIKAKREERRPSKASLEEDVKEGISEATLRPTDTKLSATSEELSHCPKCREKGSVCIKNCPKAKKK